MSLFTTTAAASYRDANGQAVSRDELRQRLESALSGIDVDLEELTDAAWAQLYNGVTSAEVVEAPLLVVRSWQERDPCYSRVAARLLLDKLYQELSSQTFDEALHLGVELGRLDPELLNFDVKRLTEAVKPDRDFDFDYLGLRTLYDRYLLKVNDQLIETPQFFWMRVAMGLALQESERERWAIEFYELLSQRRFVCSTPTLFNSGTRHPQLSSCFLSTTDDSLEHVFKVISDNARLSKWAGGLGNDWSSVRATGSPIQGTGGQSQGVVPFLKVANDTSVAVNQGGKRKGALCAYLECWHLDFEEFLDLRKNTGDDRRRTHDMNTAAWIPDLFMQRLAQDGLWTLFCPSEVPGLHDSYGSHFAELYSRYEELAAQGKIRAYRQLPAQQLWRKLLGRLFETGHPWITFKDPSNIRSPQDHMGVVHSSNLCTEILLNTSSSEVAVCNLGSVNLPMHIQNKKMCPELLESTISTAMRLLDNVIDLNFYPIPEAASSNRQHRPLGLGLMGFQDALYELGMSYAERESADFADESMELISYYAILSSSLLAKERGPYPSYQGSKWQRGQLPVDSIELLDKERGEHVDVDRKGKLDWEPVRKAIRRYGMRNSNCMAIAPTATIANIAGVSPSIEPCYRHLYVKSNLSGEFTVLNRYLVEALKSRGLWDKEMIEELKHSDGDLTHITRLDDKLKALFPTAFTIPPEQLIECASRRQKWIDQGQSLNLYFAEARGAALDSAYQLAWRKGLKTTYYARTLGATQIEKSSLDINQRSLQPRWMKHRSPSAEIQAPACPINDPTCESCQ